MKILYTNRTAHASKRPSLCSFELILIFSFAILIPACSMSKPPVYIPPEYSSPHSGQYTTPQAPSGPSTQAVPRQGPIISGPSGFKKQDLPSAPTGHTTTQTQPQTQAQPPQQTGPGHQQIVKKQEEQSPQLLASMQMVNEARAPLDRGKPDLAIPVLERAIQVDVQNGEAFMLLARAWRQKGAKPKALEFAKKAEILYQDQPERLKEVYQLEANLYKEMGNSAKASEYRKKAAALR